MAVEAINIAQTPKRNNAHTMLLGTSGAILGMAGRYYLPTKSELSNLKELKADEFFKTATAATRAQNRSILKYAGVGALLLAGIGLVSKFIKDMKTPKSEIQPNKIQYSKMGALIDSSDYACEIMWWGE